MDCFLVWESMQLKTSFMHQCMVMHFVKTITKINLHYFSAHKFLILNMLMISGNLNNKYGIYKFFVSNVNNFEVISELEAYNSYIVANEFVFPNKYQIVPICSFNVMRTEFYILWANENEE